jgi:hypothetical protein
MKEAVTQISSKLWKSENAKYQTLEVTHCKGYGGKFYVLEVKSKNQECIINDAKLPLMEALCEWMLSNLVFYCQWEESVRKAVSKVHVTFYVSGHISCFDLCFQESEIIIAVLA